MDPRGARRFALPKSFEEVRKKIRSNSLPVVADGDLGVGVDPLQHHGHTTTSRSELDGVGEQIPDHLLKTIGVTGNRRRPRIENRLQTNVLGVGRRLYDVDGRPDDAREIDGTHLEPHLARCDTGYVEQIVYQLSLSLGRPLDRLHGEADLLVVQVAPPQDFRPRHDRRQGGPQLVRHRREEGVLRPVGFFELFTRFLRRAVCGLLL